MSADTDDHTALSADHDKTLLAECCMILAADKLVAEWRVVVARSPRASLPLHYIRKKCQQGLHISLFLSHASKYRRDDTAMRDEELDTDVTLRKRSLWSVARGCMTGNTDTPADDWRSIICVLLQSISMALDEGFKA